MLGIILGALYIMSLLLAYFSGRAVEKRKALKVIAELTDIVQKILKASDDLATGLIKSIEEHEAKTITKKTTTKAKK